MFVPCTSHRAWETGIYLTLCFAFGPHALLLQATATLTAGSSSNCNDEVHHDTISMFSHEPLTFSYEVPDDSVCAAKCGGVATCRAWLYSTSGQECQLYREDLVFQAQSPHFVLGSSLGFSGSSETVSSLVITAPSQSLVCCSNIFFFYSMVVISISSRLDVYCFFLTQCARYID